MRGSLRLVVFAASIILTLIMPAAALADSPFGSPPANGHAHTPIHGRPVGPSPSPSASASGSAPYSPAQIRHAYGFDSLPSTGAGQIIGIVDAYDDPTAASDLETFISTFGLTVMYGLPGQKSCNVVTGPHPCFQKVYAQSKPRTNGGWALEESLDVQWAHAVAPRADVLLVEARDSSFTNLFSAVDVAVNRGAHAVSMSWGSGDFVGESAYDSHFQHTGVVFTAAAGDSGSGPLYPSTSPDVVGVGGTSLPLDGSGNRVGPETAWSGSGGGISANEPEPGYQSGYPIPNTGGKRGAPDVSYDADPSTGVYVYDSTSYNGSRGWWQVGGTSAGAPQWAALVALADQARGSALSSNSLTNSPLYKAAASAVYGADYVDISSGTNGSCGSVCTARTGYDFVTGLGSPHAANLVPYLASH